MAYVLKWGTNCRLHPVPPPNTHNLNGFPTARATSKYLRCHLWCRGFHRYHHRNRETVSRSQCEHILPRQKLLFLAEPLLFSLARCNPRCRFKYPAWRLVGWFQVPDERSRYHTTRLQEGISHVSNGCRVVTLGRIVQVCAIQGCGTHPLVGHSKQPRTPERTSESVRQRVVIQGSHQ